MWTLKTPKAASSTLQDLIVGLAKHHPGRFVVNTRQLRVDPTVTSNPSHPDGKDDMLQRCVGMNQRGFVLVAFKANEVVMKRMIFYSVRCLCNITFSLFLSQGRLL